MKKIYIISFSPTGSSERVAEEIAEAFDGEKVCIDLCESIDSGISIEEDSICLFAMPCYGGRIPQIAAERLSKIQGLNTAAILCITFGNRAYEDALLELAELAEQNGFQAAAGCAVVTEHNIMHIYGQGRPDASDHEEIKRFAMDIEEKLSRKDKNIPCFPGKHPYKEWNGSKLPILSDEKTCIKCGLCALKCPVKAISPDGSRTDQSICINCMRCINICPKQSRSIPEDMMAAMRERLAAACEGRKENEFYI